VGPGEKLTDRKKPLAAAGRSNNQKVAKLRAGLHGLDPQNVVEASSAKEKACLPLGTRLEEVLELVNAGKAGGVELIIS
jgi:hypothetical protein